MKYFIALLLIAFHSTGQAGGGDPTEITPVENTHPDAIINLNVMFVYSQQAEDHFKNGIGVQNRVNEWISYANQVHANSKLPTRYKIVHLQKVNLESGKDSRDVLSDMRNARGAFSNIKNLRNQYNADFVAMLYNDGDGSSCGIGYVSTSSANAYSVNYVNGGCRQSTLPHELGHNSGLGHGNLQGSRGVKSYAGGHGDRDGGFVTVMMYPRTVPGSRRIDQFSDASRDDCPRNTPCGVIESGDNPADSVRFMRENQWVYDAYRRTDHSQIIGKRWESFSNQVSQLSGAADGTLWGIDNNDTIYQYNGTQFIPVGGALVNISVGSKNHIWGVNRDGNLYRRDGDRWQRMSGRATQVSVGNDGETWHVNSANNIYRYEGENRWRQIGGKLTKVSVGKAGIVWGINADGETFQRVGNSWKRHLIQLDDISVGADGRVHGILPGGGLVAYVDSQWVRLDGYLSQISVGKTGKVWGVNNQGSAYSRIF